jgi:hypothetical protein
MINEWVGIGGRQWLLFLCNELKKNEGQKRFLWNLGSSEV